MPVRRRTFLTITAATAATGVGAAVVAAERLHDRSPAGSPPQAQGAEGHQAAGAPDEPFAVGVREFSWLREGRPLLTRVWYPAIGTPGGDPVLEAMIADGRFPVVAFSHGMRTTPESYLPLIVPLAAAGFVVAAPNLPDNTAESVTNGTRPKDVAEVVSLTLALDTAPDDPFNGHLDDRNGVGAAGHSLGGMTTHALLTSWRDERITTAALFAAFAAGDPAGAPANVLFVHGDSDPTANYTDAWEMYRELTWPKGFLTHLGQGHDEYVYADGETYPRTRDTLVDWMRWSLYADTAARDRLRADATSDGTTWESALS